jgi:hypothetical protein
MPLFSDPYAPRGPLAALLHLARYGAVMLGTFGWATVAVGLAKASTFLWLVAAVGWFASLLQSRAYLSSAVVELIALSAAIALVPPALSEWAWTGALFIGVARTATLAWERYNKLQDPSG